MQRQASEETRAPERQRKNSTGLPDRLKAGIETLSGLSLDDVHVHYNSTKPAQLQALAYTQGTDIHVAQGQEKHVSHEAWHVVQQKQGMVQPTMQVSGVAINDDVRLEREADVMGARAARTLVTAPSEGRYGGGSPPRAQHAGQGMLQDQQPHDAGASRTVQRYRIVNGPQYTLDRGRAGTSELEVALDGTIGSQSANSPTPQSTQTVPGRDAIRTQYNMHSANEPFAMHLVNGRLGGSGAHWQNLAWGTHNFNVQHTNRWELYRQAEAGAYKSGFMGLKVQAFYKSNDRNDPADFYFLNSLQCSHRLLDADRDVIDAWQTVTITDGQRHEEADPDYVEDADVDMDDHY